MTRPETMEALAEVLASLRGRTVIAPGSIYHAHARTLLNAIDAGQVPGLVTSEAQQE